MPRFLAALGALSLLFLSYRPGLSGDLASDARVGVLSVAEGTVLVRPVGRDRWSPLAPRDLLFPGDLVRVGLRGPNAAEIRLVPKGSLVLGPGATVEVPERGSVRLVSGDAEVSAPDGAAVALSGPGGFRREVTTATWVRAREREVAVLPEAPRWLTGYRASTTQEWMGSLVAQVDGRDVPLSVGYHKVTVEVRDQIARTTVEQSFVNATPSRLEGVFHFPLPPDASISGFGMWIGEELVEADLVERERAREIYEDILRRKKDPGLLEWEGGNLFRARVFPIEGHSEKRIRLRYTQVLPLEGDTWRYRYALRSELLRARPLRELAITVSVLSEAPLLEVASPTHECRIRRTDHEAVVEYGAQEHSPDRDFEVAGRVGKAQGLTAVAHRRGEDGFFMLLLAPPDPEADGWQRDLLPEGDPLDLVLVADTSGSMDEAAREAQARFLDALFSLLSEKDRFRLMTLDVEPRWLSEEPSAATEENAVRALAFLEARGSLGWTDLERGLGEAFSKAGPGTQVIYLGDGIPTAGDADPIATAGRLKSLAAEAKGAGHAVAVSSAYEKPVLDAIASIGGGSVRTVGDAPATTAKTLLAEIARPGVKGLAVEVEGVPTAKVYPERLPNAPLGAQQVVLGRYLPGGGAKEARVRVRGTEGGKPVVFTASFRLPGPDEGNSFLPRLWARHHLDALLATGSDARTKAEVVAFSREYQIMTPYTSFLVLESDEDRERYGVERTVKMRDAEAFFAQARDRAALEIARRQMEVARSWRERLRRRALAEIAGLGRDLPIGPAVAFGDGPETGTAWGGDFAGRTEGRTGGGGGRFRGPGGGSMPGLREPGDPTPPPAASAPAEEPILGAEEKAGDNLKSEAEEEGLDGGDGGLQATPEFADEDEEVLEEAKEAAGKDARKSLGRRARERTRRDAEFSRGYLADDYREDDGILAARAIAPTPPGAQWFGFPSLAPPPAAPPPTEEPAWDPDLKRLLASLDRRPALRAVNGGVEVRTEFLQVHPLRGTPGWRNESRLLVSPRRWHFLSDARGSEPSEQWVTEEERGSLAAGRRLGRRRPAVDLDREAWPFPIPDLSTVDLLRLLRTAPLPPTVSRQGDLVTVTVPMDLRDETQRVLVIDPAKSVLVEDRWVHRGRLRGATRLSQFTEVAGRWWAGRVESIDDRERTTSVTTVFVRALEGEAFATAIDAALAGRDDSIFLALLDPDAVAARQAIADGRAGSAEHLALCLDAVGRGQWDEAAKGFEVAAGSLAGKPGLEWMRATLLAASRTGEEAKRHILALGAAVAADPRPAAAPLAGILVGIGNQVLGPNEALALLDILVPAFPRQAKDAAWWSMSERRWRAGHLESIGRALDAHAIRTALTRDHPDDLSLFQEWLGGLQRLEGFTVVAAACRERVESSGPWLAEERDQLSVRWTDALFQLRRLADLDAVTAAWTAAGPLSPEAWTRRASVLQYLNRSAEVDAWIARRLEAALPGPEDRAGRAELEAAVTMALGYGWNLQQRRLPLEWVDPLATLFLRVARGDDPDRGIAGRIHSDWRYRQTDAHAGLATALRQDLVADGAIESMPTTRLTAYLQQWTTWQPAVVEPAVFRSTVDRLLARWEASASAPDRAVLADLALHLLDAHGEAEEAISFLRRRHVEATGADKRSVGGRLLERLLDTTKDAAREDECFALAPTLLDPDATVEARRSAAAHLARSLAAKAYEWRYEVARGSPEEREKMTRAEAREKQRAARPVAREGTAARLVAARDALGEPLRPWLELERLGYLAERFLDPLAVEAEARELLDAIPTKSEEYLDWLLAERTVLVLSHLGTRRSAPEGLADRVLALLAAREAAKDGLIDWRYAIFRLLVALDRADDLERALSSWIEPGRVDPRWRIALGYLHAERNRLKEAAERFEEVRAGGGLGAPELGALADWYLVLREDVRREAALDARYAAEQEWQLSQRIWGERARLSRRGEGIPGDLDPEILRVIRVLLAKASHPANHLHVVRSLYQVEKDHRLLEALPHAVLGHSQEAVYGVLAQIGSIVGEVHEEATCDEIVSRLEALGAGERTALDRRALLLFASRVENRAAEVPKADPVHAERAVRALQAAFGLASWAPGELPHYAGHLASLGRPGSPALGREQMRQLEALAALATDRIERLQVSTSLAQAIHAHGRGEEAADRLFAALRAFRPAPDAPLGAEADGPLQTLVSWCTALRRHRDAETLLEGEAALAKHSDARDEFRVRIFRLYASAMKAGVALSIGERGDLLRVGAERIERWLFEGPPHRIDEALQAHGALHLAAREVRAARQVGERYLEFCRSTLPEVFGRLPAEEASLLGIVAGTLAQLEGPRAAIALVLDRMDLEPTWRIRVGLGVWDHLGWSLANWRHEAGSIGTIEPRLLARVLAGLEDSLVHLNQGAEAGLTHRGYKTFWDEKRNDFAATAAKVAELHGSSPAILLFAANYLRHGLGLLREAVATLQAADERGMLREDGRWTLAVWLVEDKRFAEALPHAERLAREKPENLDYRLLVVQALFGTGRKPEALAALEGTVADWRERKVFDEGVAARTAHLALDIESPARAAEWIEEAIRMRREAGRSPVDGTLSSHYGILARARSLLGQTDAAVQAAAAAVVAWGRDQTNRGQALEALRLVLSTARDLDAFATRYQAEVAKTGLDAPVIRRALGSVFLDAKRYAEAALQLRVARDLAPEDAEVHRLLVKTHDEAGEPAEALAAALTAVRLDPRSVTAYQDLARRYRAAGDLAASERALTGMVEWTANEAEGHRALAQEREGASRLEEAVVQWRLVVRARSLEPDGWLSLAVALGKAGDAEGARATLDEVLARTWDERFGDVRARAAEILRSLPPAPPRPGR